MTPAPLILIVDDEPPIRRLVHVALSGEGYRALQAETAAQALRLAAAQPPDVVILDLGLPDDDGQVVLRRLREWLTAPVIILSARDQEKEKVAALDAGADDYVTKPFSAMELLARVRVALRRRARGGDSDSVVYRVDELAVDCAARYVTVRGAEVRLTPIEFRLLSTLARHAGKVLTHRYLLTEVWGPGHAGENHYVRVVMANLRRKIEDDPARPRYLLTEQGVGYRMTSD